VHATTELLVLHGLFIMNDRLLGYYCCLFLTNLRLISQSQIMKCPLLMHTGWHKSSFTLQVTNIKCQITFSPVCIY